jgi:hypothetical protein
MSLTGGKRKVNKGLRDWVAFVKKVQKEEKISYKDAIHRAKQRKDKGEKWMSGGQTSSTTSEMLTTSPDNNSNVDAFDNGADDEVINVAGGRRRRRTVKRGGKGKRRTVRRGGRSRSRSRSSRRH